jgi:hypothetical protein
VVFTPASHCTPPQAIVTSVLKAARSANFLHLRIERDWLEHCRTWSNIPDGQVRDNCMNNSERIDTVLPDFGLKAEVPLLVETYWEDIDPQSVEMQAVRRLIDQGYQVGEACTWMQTCLPGAQRLM